MDQDYITRREHEEFARRMDSENERIKDENARQNKRIAIVEESVSEFNKLALQIEKIGEIASTNMNGEETPTSLWRKY